jgi:hypothetical protein
MTAFGADVLRLTLDILPLLLAIALARLVRSGTHAALVVMNLWLFMELLTTLADRAIGSVISCWRGSWQAQCRSGRLRRRASMAPLARPIGERDRALG